MRVCILTSVYRNAEPLACELASLGHKLHVLHGESVGPLAVAVRVASGARRRPQMVHAIESGRWTLLAGWLLAKLVRAPLIVQYAEAASGRIVRRVTRTAAAVITNTVEVERHCWGLGAKRNDTFAIPAWPKFVEGSEAWMEIALRYESVYRYTLAEGTVATQLSIGGLDGTIST